MPSNQTTTNEPGSLIKSGLNASYVISVLKNANSHDKINPDRS